MKASEHFAEIAGIIGGVGPEATTYFTSLLTKIRGKVQRDQEHIPFLLFNNPQIPDRTEYILEQGVSPLPELVHTATILKQAGATFLIIPCNTAHALIKPLEANAQLPVLNMITLTSKSVLKTYGKRAKVGLLATTGTIKSNLYQQAFNQLSSNIDVLIPDEAGQEKVMKGIYAIKASSVTPQSFSLLYDEAEKLIQRGADVIVLGCTEIPLALTKRVCLFPIIDPMEVLAQQTLTRTLASKKISKQNKRSVTRQDIHFLPQK